MSALLFGVEPGDPAIHAGAITLAIVMTLGGSLRPALRAASIDPAVTTRMDCSAHVRACRTFGQL